MIPQDLVCVRCWRDFFDTEAFQNCCTHDHTTNNSIKTVSSVKEIKSSVNCTWCSYVKSFVSDSWAPEQNVTVYLSNGFINSFTPKGNNVFHLDVSCHSLEGKWIGGSALFLHAWTTAEDAASEHVTARPLQTNVNTETAKMQLNTWWQDCAEHGCCNKSDIVLPKRVIEVSPPGQQHPRLIEPEHLDGAYATLSYCWGKEAFSVLTQSNRHELLKELDPLTLPLTVSHAISTARDLSIPYLWVDALCIIQDSEEDKIAEIARMKQIYSSSALAIVAASASSAFDGFLHPRRHTEISSTVPVRVRPGLFGTMSINELDAACYDERLEPIAKRAWTMQEQLLAKRCLTFTSHTMMWRCPIGIRNFGDSLYFPHDLDMGYNDNDEKYSLNLHSLLLNEESSVPRDTILSCWMRLVTAYSLRATSFEHDKLNAIAGIASHPFFSRNLGSCYLAGLWEYNLARQLTWCTSHRHRTLSENGQTVRRPVNYRAPSWSWASIEGGVVSFDFALDDEDESVGEPVCDVVHCSTTLKFPDLNPLGEVTTGILKMRAACRNAWFDPSTYNVYLLSVPTHAKDGPYDEESISFEEAAHMYVRDFTTRYPDVDFHEEPEATHGTDSRNMHGRHDETGNHSPVMVVCVAILQNQERDDGVEGLILVSNKTGRTESVFRRIGVFERGKNEDFSKETATEIDIV